MSDLSATDREILRMVFGRERDRIWAAFVNSDARSLRESLAEISAAIEGHQAGRARPQQGATKEVLAYREKRFHVVKGE